MPRSYPRVEESGRWKLIQELKQVPAHWESEWAPNYRRFPYAAVQKHLSVCVEQYSLFA